MIRSADEEPTLRDYRETDAAALSRLALAAFEEFQSAYSDWAAMSASISQMPSLAAAGVLIIAEAGGGLLGAVAYVGPGQPKVPFFDPQRPIIRMLVVDPAARRRGVGHTLMEECCRRARRDGSQVLALHTSPIMIAALAMYRKMGFMFQRDAPRISGVPSAVYLLGLLGCMDPRAKQKALSEPVVSHQLLRLQS
jgi:ribosomal protein S18 acetylase RimI-like enzyme